MRFLKAIIFFTSYFVVLVPQVVKSELNTHTPFFHWQSGAPLPVQQGLSSGFTGFHNGTLIYAGGNNFDKPKWEGGIKAFHDEIYLLEDAGKNGSEWQKVGNLPFAVADGAAVESAAGLICLGGTDGNKAYDAVFILKWDASAKRILVDTTTLPPLPEACYQLSAAKLGTVIYVTGGRNVAGEAMSNTWKLDLKLPQRWEKLPSWPGPPRFGPVLQVQNNGEVPCLYVFGGKSDTEYLTDGYVLDPRPGGGWKRAAAMPRAALLAPALAYGPSHILVFSGSDGHDPDGIRQMKAADDYRFIPEILAYHTITDTWVPVGELPGGLVGAQARLYQGEIWIAGGETAPSVRTPAVVTGLPDRVTSKSVFGWPDYTILLLYLLVLAGISWFFSQRNQTANDYLLGGQRVPAWAAGISVMATQVSAIGFMTIPAKSYAVNWAYFIGVFTWFIAVPVVTVYFIPLIRSMRITSVYEYLENRFNATVRLMAAILFLLFQLARMGLVLYLPALALSAVTPLDTLTCILVMGVLSTFYTVIGGIEGVIWIEVVQALLLFGGALACVVIGIYGIEGGWGTFWEVAVTDEKLSFGKWNWDVTSSTLLVIVIGNIFIRLGNLTTDQAVVQRYLTTPTVKEAQKTVWTDVWASIPWAIVIYLLGTVLYVFYKQHPGELNPLSNTDGILPHFIAQNAPMGMSGLIIAGIFAASMSSSQSHIHSLATIVTTDFYGRFRKLTPEQTYRTARTWTLVLGGVSTLLATSLLYLDIFSLLDFFQELTGLFIGASSGLFILGMFTKKANSTGALLGTFLSVAVLYAVKLYTPLSFWLFSMIGFTSCVTSGYLLSLWLPGKKQTSGLTIYETDRTTSN